WPMPGLCDAFRWRQTSMNFRRVMEQSCAAAVSILLAGGVLAGHALAQDKTVRIGAVLPLSGASAGAGEHAKAAIEVALDIINNAHPEFGHFSLAANAVLA